MFDPGDESGNLLGAKRKAMANTHRATPLAPEMRLSARCLFSALRPFKDLRADVPLQYVMTFLLVMMEEGQSVTEYASRAGVRRSVMSRHILDLSTQQRSGAEGYDLLTTRPSPEELRKYEVYLTPKGRALAHTILNSWLMAGGK